MLPPKLAQLRAQIEKDQRQISVQKELLEELIRLDRFLDKANAATTKQEVSTAALNEQINFSMPRSAITSGPGGTCQCCGRSL